MERERSSWLSHKENGQKRDRHMTPPPDLRQIFIKRQSSDLDQATEAIIEETTIKQTNAVIIKNVD